MNLKSKTLSGFKWSFVDTIIKYLLSFVIGVILARILSPSDYGLVGMSAIFIAVSRVFIDGGFSDSLIRKINCTNEDYSTVFLFNMFVSIVFYSILFFSAPLISKFYNEPILTDIIRISGFSLIIGASATIQAVTLRKKINFKLQAIIGFFSTIISGSISIVMAIMDYGVWSIIYGSLFQSLTTSSLLWLLNKQHFNLIFKISIFKEHFGFGSKIMMGSFIHVVYNNIYYAMIGKYFNSAMLGYYTKADNFQKMFSENLDTIVRQVTYPVLSQMQDQHDRLKSSYRMLIRTTFFFSLLTLTGLFVVAKPFILVVIGEKWLPSVPYLQLLCCVGVFFPLISININVLNVKGRSDISLKLAVLRVLLSVPVLFMGYYWGILIMIIGILFTVIILYLIVTYYTKIVIIYSLSEQLKDIWPAIKMIFCALTPVFIIGQILEVSSLLILIIQFVIGTSLIITFGELFKNQEYLLIRNFIKAKIINNQKISKRL